jgi:hypothetical protein
MVVVGQDHIGKSQGNLTGWGELLFGGRESHRTAGVDKHIDKEIRLFVKEFDIEPVAAGENAPIEIADIIPRRVPSVIGEFEACPPTR